MNRIVEPELMNEAEQSLAYAQADFSEPHNHFIHLFQAKFGTFLTGKVLDLGCGTGDITLRFAKSYPNCKVDGVDGAESMLAYAYQDLQLCSNDVGKRINFIKGILPQISFPCKSYETIISNSLLHHLHNPLVLWESVNKYSQTNTKIFIMDLLRPDTPEQAQAFVNQYACNEPAILQRDFYNSLCAAFTISEVAQQLQKANLDYLTIQQISDRHLIIFGELN